MIHSLPLNLCVVTLFPPFLCYMELAAIGNYFEINLFYLLCYWLPYKGLDEICCEILIV